MHGQRRRATSRTRSALPLGISWSVFFCQRAGESLKEPSGAASTIAKLRDRGPTVARYLGFTPCLQVFFRSLCNANRWRPDAKEA